MHVKAAPLEALVLDAVRAMPAKGESSRCASACSSS
jgi:hypothetical protein